MSQRSGHTGTVADDTGVTATHLNGALGPASNVAEGRSWMDTRQRTGRCVHLCGLQSRGTINRPVGLLLPRERRRATGTLGMLSCPRSAGLWVPVDAVLHGPHQGTRGARDIQISSQERRRATQDHALGTRTHQKKEQSLPTARLPTRSWERVPTLAIS